MLTKADPTESNTGYAQGGIAAAVGDDDSPALHAADTMRAGDGLCDEPAVRVLVEEGPRYVRELMDWGTRFDRDADGRLALGREAAHSVRRVLHAGDATGREIGRVLWERASALPAGVDDQPRARHRARRRTAAPPAAFATSIGTAAPREVRAGRRCSRPAAPARCSARRPIPPVATGDGIALAYHAGARVADLEFVQFHPTALNRAGAPRFLISEALRGEGRGSSTTAARRS